LATDLPNEPKALELLAKAEANLALSPKLLSFAASYACLAIS